MISHLYGLWIVNEYTNELKELKDILKRQQVVTHHVTKSQSEADRNGIERVRLERIERKQKELEKSSSGASFDKGKGNNE